MHFSKTYSQLLSSLPPELREDAIEYRQLKKLIHKVVDELAALGLSPDVLQRVLQATADGELQAAVDAASIPESRKGKEKAREETIGPSPPPAADTVALADLAEVLGEGSGRLEVVQVLYEFDVKEGRIEPRLRLRVGPPPSGKVEDVAEDVTPVEGTIEASTVSIVASSPSNAAIPEGGTLVNPDPPPPLPEESSPLLDDRHVEPTWLHEYIVPLASDSAFFELLSTALQMLSARLQAIRAEFMASLDPLARGISSGARPMSTTNASFHAYSQSSNPADVRITASGASHSPFALFAYHGTGAKSDLYTWREIFQLYVEAEIFQGLGERDRGDRTVEEAEERLTIFVDRLRKAGLGDGNRLTLKESKAALQNFLQMNLFLLNIKKLQYANTEAIRKILKKHTKRTALPLPALALAAPMTIVEGPDSAPISSQPLDMLAIFPSTATSLPRLLVQAVGETLLPIIPAVDDYACLICTSIAFKPIRLTCGHLFCVRCLVKLQKKGKANCPMCRAPTVLVADRSNVDWALLNFMKDWFPVEAKAKLKQNEAEAAREELQELGFNADTPGCVIA